mmetsp:Transcript_116/g.555  ORF Transcript_116/g.555 Transcript_116/m.555 type:complete len:213 (-) Transcript_116:674-1312(-)
MNNNPEESDLHTARGRSDAPIGVDRTPRRMKNWRSRSVDPGIFPAPVVAVEHLHQLLPGALLVKVLGQHARLIVLHVPAHSLVLRLEVIRGHHLDSRLVARDCLSVHVAQSVLLEPLHAPLPLPQRVGPFPVRHLHRLLRRHQQHAASGNLAPVPALSARVLQVLGPRRFHHGHAAHLGFEQRPVPRRVLVRGKCEDDVHRHVVLRALLEGV